LKRGNRNDTQNGFDARDYVFSVWMHLEQTNASRCPAAAANGVARAVEGMHWCYIEK